MTHAEAVAQLRALTGPELLRAQGNGLRRLARAIRTDTKKRLQQRGVGRTVWGRGFARKGGGMTVVKVGRVKKSGSGEGADLSIAVSVAGLAAIQEEGGRTKPHEIKPKSAKVLAWSVPSQGFARKVNHPGAQMPKIPALGPAVEALAPKGDQYIAESVDKMIEKVAGRG